MKNLKISQKIMAIISIIIIIFIGASIYSISQVRKLGIIHDQVSMRSQNAFTIQEIADMGYKAYRIIADAEINGDLKATEADWKGLKEEMNLDFNNLEKILDKDDVNEMQILKEATSAKNEMILIFENEMLPLLKQVHDSITESKTDALDNKIDEKVAIIKRPDIFLIMSSRFLCTTFSGREKPGFSTLVESAMSMRTLLGPAGPFTIGNARSYSATSSAVGTPSTWSSLRSPV